jgi:hypothetical protein
VSECDECERESTSALRARLCIDEGVCVCGVGVGGSRGERGVHTQQTARGNVSNKLRSKINARLRWRTTRRRGEKGTRTHTLNVCDEVVWLFVCDECLREKNPN